MFKVKRFYKTVFLFQILCNALSFILWFQQFNSFIIKLIFSVIYFFFFFFFFWLFSVSDNVLVSSLVRFIYNFLVDDRFCNFSSIAAAVAGFCRKCGVVSGCSACQCRSNGNCFFSLCGMTL